MVWDPIPPLTVWCKRKGSNTQTSFGAARIRAEQFVETRGVGGGCGNMWEDNHGTAGSYTVGPHSAPMAELWKRHLYPKSLLSGLLRDPGTS